MNLNEPLIKVWHTLKLPQQKIDLSQEPNLKSNDPIDPSLQRPKIWVDADACPVAIKEILFRTTKRLNLQLIFIANQSVNIPDSKLVISIVVPHGADLADHKIVDMMSQGDVVISGSIKGNVAAKAVDVKDSGMIAGNITSEEVLTEGKIKGKIKATSVNLKLTSSTDTQMVSSTLVVETGAALLGKFKIGA